MGNVPLYRVSKHHAKVFKDNKPRSYYFILMALFDFWAMHPLRPELISLSKFAPKENRQVFTNTYIEEVPLKGLDGVAPAWHFSPGVHRSADLIKQLPQAGKILHPLVIFFRESKGYVYEGHHRSGAAAALGWKTIPALVLHFAGEALGVGQLSNVDREQMAVEQTQRGLPITARIHGNKIVYWTEKELKQFMVPRPGNPGKYHMRNMQITGCFGVDPRWEGVPYIPVGTVK